MLLAFRQGRDYLPVKKLVISLYIGVPFAESCVKFAYQKYIEQIVIKKAAKQRIP
jgi:hypothetical protein